MTTLRGAPAGVFELKRSSSGQALHAGTPQYTIAKDDSRTNDDTSPAESELDGEEEEEEEVDETVREDMIKLKNTFPEIADRFRLINRIGEGWFSSSSECMAS